MVTRREINSHPLPKAELTISSVQEEVDEFLPVNFRYTKPIMILNAAFLVAVLSMLSSTAAADCIVCADIPNKGMISKNKECTPSRVSKGNKCVDNVAWIENGYCQKSCFESGRGYEGIVCCEGDTLEPTPTTLSPVPAPTAPAAEEAGGGGEWSEVYDMTVIPIHTLLLSDGQILSYGTNDQGEQGGELFYEVWDHSKGIHYGHKLLEHGTETDTFCSSLNYDVATGNVVIMGGDGRPVGLKGAGIKTVLEYISDSEEIRLHPKGNMTYARWYGTSVNLPNGEIFVVGGRDDQYLGADIPEVFSPDSGFRPLPSASVPAIKNDLEKNYWYYPHVYINSKGQIITFMPRKGEQVYLINVEGDGSIELLGQRPFQAHPRTPSILYRVNHAAFLDDEGNIWSVDISDHTNITWEKKENLGKARVNGSMAMLPDGRVAIVGGANNVQVAQGTVEDAVLDIQIWDPESNTIETGPDQEKPRLYHSTAIALTDGCIMSAGGGSPGPVKNMNGQLFCLYNSPARPVIEHCPSIVDTEATFGITVDDASSVSRVTATKSGSSSHTRNCDARWLELDFDVLDAKTLRVYTENKNVMVGGVYMFNIIDDKGEVSEACIVGVDMAII